MEEYGPIQFEFKCPTKGKRVYFLARQSARQIFDIMYTSYFYKYVRYKWKCSWYTDKYFNMRTIELYDPSVPDVLLDHVASMEPDKPYIMEVTFDIPKREDVPCSIDCTFKAKLQMIKRQEAQTMDIGWNGSVLIRVHDEYGSYTKLHFVPNEFNGQVSVIGNDNAIEQLAYKNRNLLQEDD